MVTRAPRIGLSRRRQIGNHEHVIPRDAYLDLARKLDWEFSYVREADVFPREICGEPYLPGEAWRGWEEPFRTSYSEYVAMQASKNADVRAVREAVGRLEDFAALPPPWINALKLHGAVLPLAEFAAVVGSLRAARFGRDSAWRNAALFGALDELRHTQIPLELMHGLVRLDPQFDFAHRFYHSNNWVAIAARHFADELLLASDPIEFAIATNFVFETGFTNLQFVGLSSLAHLVGDRAFEKVLTSIQSDEARHSQIGGPVLEHVIAHDPAYAQRLVDKWFWRSFHLFAIVTGFAMDYLTPLAHRTHSFKEFMHEWVLDQFVDSLERYGLSKPWYWDEFLTSLEHYHHQVYVSAYTYRMTVWFDLVVPSPEERAWLRDKYPGSFSAYEAVWERVDVAWSEADVGNEMAVHGTAIVGFCNLCQLVLCEGTPQQNHACTLDHAGRRYIFCSAPCRAIFEAEPERYASHRDVVARVLAGEAPGNLAAMLREYFGVTPQTWGRDVYAGDYRWLARKPKPSHGGT